jgi:hypothetical protein
MPSGATYPAEGHSRISNAWLDEHASDENAVWYCLYKDGKDPRHYSDANGKGIMARGIIIRSNGITDGAAAVVRGYLWDESSIDADDYYLTAGVVHPLRFRRIYAMGTTARGVKILY